MAVTKNDLKFYFTNANPFDDITDLSQSIGGYPVNSLSSNSVTTNNISLNELLINNLENGYSLIDDEIIFKNGNSIIRGCLQTNIKTHTSGSPITLLNKGLFNNDFDIDGNQYRCIAVKNEGIDPFYNLSFYIKSNSLTENTLIKLAVESPVSPIVNGSVDSGTIINLVDSSLSFYPDNYFSNSVITFLSGNNINQKRIILSFDQETSTIILDSALPFSVQSGDLYTIDQSPSQRIKSGTETPDNLIFSTSSINNMISIDVDNNRENGNNLLPNEIIYLWIKRTRNKNSQQQLNNRFIISFRYGVI